MFELLSRYSGECTGQGGIDAVCHFVYPCLPGLVFMASASVSVLLAICRPVLVYGAKHTHQACSCSFRNLHDLQDCQDKIHVRLQVWNFVSVEVW